MNNKKNIQASKEVLRQHLENLLATGEINNYYLQRDGAYYAKDVFAQLLKKGFITNYGTLIQPFNIERFIDGLYLCRTKEPIKAIGKRAAKSIGQKMSKSRIDIAEIIKQNEHRPTYEDRAAIDYNAIPKANPLESIPTEDLLLEIARRGFSGSVTYSINN
jgi:hypothetical protein